MSESTITERVPQTWPAFVDQNIKKYGLWAIVLTGTVFALVWWIIPQSQESHKLQLESAAKLTESVVASQQFIVDAQNRIADSLDSIADSQQNFVKLLNQQEMILVEMGKSLQLQRETQQDFKNFMCAFTEKVRQEHGLTQNCVEENGQKLDKIQENLTNQ